MPARCPIHVDELYDGENSKPEHRLHAERGCAKCLAEQEMKKTLDPASVVKAANERKIAARAAAQTAARRAAEAKAEAEKHLREAEAAEAEASSALGDAAAPAA